jgi:hypothetical protein
MAALKSVSASLLAFISVTVLQLIAFIAAPELVAGQLTKRVRCCAVYSSRAVGGWMRSAVVVVAERWWWWWWWWWWGWWWWWCGGGVIGHKPDSRCGCHPRPSPSQRQCSPLHDMSPPTQQPEYLQVIGIKEIALMYLYYNIVQSCCKGALVILSCVPGVWGECLDPTQSGHSHPTDGCKMTRPSSTRSVHGSTIRGPSGRLLAAQQPV